MAKKRAIPKPKGAATQVDSFGQPMAMGKAINSIPGKKPKYNSMSQIRRSFDARHQRRDRHGRFA